MSEMIPPQQRSRDDADREVTSTKIRRALLSWFGRNGRQFPWRRSRASLYQRVIAEVLLQRTQAATVANFFDHFLALYPDWRQLSTASVKELGKVLRPIGLWQRRANSLFALARAMAPLNGRFPGSREEIESLPGVGQYIGNAIILFSKGQPEPLLDVNMARVLERLFGPRQLVDIRFDPHLQQVARLVVRGRNAVKINWAILDLAAIVCKSRNPACHICPIRRFCSWPSRADV